MGYILVPFLIKHNIAVCAEQCVTYSVSVCSTFASETTVLAATAVKTASPFMRYTALTKHIYAQSLTRLLKVLSKRIAPV